MNLQERRQLESTVDTLLRSQQPEVVSLASTARKALEARNWKRAKEAIDSAVGLVRVKTTLNQLLVTMEVCSSFADCRRLVESGAVRVNGSKPPVWNMVLKAGDRVQVGDDRDFTHE